MPSVINSSQNSSCVEDNTNSQSSSCIEFKTNTYQNRAVLYELALIGYFKVSV